VSVLSVPLCEIGRGNTDWARKSWYTTQLKKWGIRKNLKDVTPHDCKVASYKVARARKIGRNVDLYFRGQHITPRVLRGERFFLSKLEEVNLDNYSTLNLALLLIITQ
jgi:hypothetical protein